MKRNDSKTRELLEIIAQLDIPDDDIDENVYFYPIKVAENHEHNFEIDELNRGGRNRKRQEESHDASKDRRQRTRQQIPDRKEKMIVKDLNDNPDEPVVIYRASKQGPMRADNAQKYSCVIGKIVILQSQSSANLLIETRIKLSHAQNSRNTKYGISF